MKQKNFIEKNLESKRYKAIEKISHETEMRIKSWAIENAVIFFPFLLSVIGWFLYATITNASLPYGEEYSFFQMQGLWWMLIGLAITILSIIFVKRDIEKAFDKQEKELSEDVYIKGARFCSLADFNKSIDQYVENEFKLSKNIKALELFTLPMMHLEEDDKQFYEEIKDLKIPRVSLATGLCVIGAPGQGKSVMINQIIKQINPTAKEIIIDVKGEFIENFYDSNRDYILCPSDIRSVRFNLVDILRSKIDTGVIAEILIIDDKQTSDPHWTTSARAVMEAILIYASKRNLSNKNIYKIITSVDELKKILEDEEAKMVAGQYLHYDEYGNIDKETKSILTTLNRKAKVLQYLSYLDDLDTEKIKFDKWIQDNKGGRLFLVATENLSKVYSPLYGVIASYLISSILDMEDTKERDYYFILDELPRLGKALGENLEKGLAVGRSKGLKFVMAMQSYSQIKKEFGEKESESILDTTNSFIVFKNNFGAQFLEKLFGKTTVIRNNESFSFGMHDMADRSQLQRQVVKESLIDESEITRLNKFEFYAKVEGCKDVLKAKLKPVFVAKNGTKKYIENPVMKIDVIVAEMEKVIKQIENRYVSFKNARNKNIDDKKAMMMY
jgi:type IV secretory pathway TraG/TraD family ATPase VirD4